MSASATVRERRPPPRVPRIAPLAWIAGAVLLGLFVHGLSTSGMSPLTLVEGIPGVVDFLREGWPPSSTDLGHMLSAMAETLDMAVVGTTVGAILSVPFALLAARNVSPHPIVYSCTRAFVALLRSVPDLVWGLVFVVAVGIGPGAGICALVVDTIGFCGRFFAERIEEVDERPIRALRATGASGPAVIVSGVIPAVAPSFIATSMFALEKSVRAAVVLGLVGAGGIGLELTNAIQLFRYQQAMTIIAMIFVVVVAIERLGTALRRRIL